jgi:hypothetical protein
MTMNQPRPSAASKAILAPVALMTSFVVAACGVTAPATTNPAGRVVPSASAPSPGPAVTSYPIDRSSPIATPLPAPMSPKPSASGVTPATQGGAFAMNLYRPGDYVAQYTFEWCVGASLQMALNLTTDRHDISRSAQESLWEMAQARSSSPFGGANPLGWTAALNDLGIGPYRLVSIADYDEALRVAATALRQTKRPVGLVMWRGRHAWVMSGFTSVGDPAATAGLSPDPADERRRRTGGLSSPRQRVGAGPGERQSPGPKSRVNQRSSGPTDVGAPRRDAAEPGASAGNAGAPGAREKEISCGPPRPYPRACWSTNGRSWIRWSSPSRALISCCFAWFVAIIPSALLVAADASLTWRAKTMTIQAASRTPMKIAVRRRVIPAIESIARSGSPGDPAGAPADGVGSVSSRASSIGV